MGSRHVVERYLAEVMTGAGTGPADELISSEDVRQRTGHFRSAFRDLELATRVLLANGDLVAGHFVGRGTHHGIFQGIPPTGRTWEPHCHAIYRVGEGRIADAWVMWDQLSLLGQFGAVERVATVSA
jgi:predicted ester cyclase